MVSERQMGAAMGPSVVQWCVVIAALVASSSADSDNLDTPSTDNDDHLLQQVVWKRCYRKLSPACLKLSLMRTVEMMSKDSTFHLVPGVYFSSNSTESPHMPPEIARSLSSDHAPLDDLVAFSLRKYLRSLTLNVNLAELVTSGNKTVQDSLIDSVTGRKKEGMGGYGAVAAMMGGTMATMMLAVLAGMAGKALLVSMMALMMSGFAAMKGGGGGGGDSKTYEVITKPIVSHVNTHSAEVQHEHHGHFHKRSADRGDEEMSKMQSQEESRYRALDDRFGWRKMEPAESRIVTSQDTVGDMIGRGHPRLGQGKFNRYEDYQSLWALGLLR